MCCLLVAQITHMNTLATVCHPATFPDLPTFRETRTPHPQQMSYIRFHVYSHTDTAVGHSLLTPQRTCPHTPSLSPLCDPGCDPLNHMGSLKAELMIPPLHGHHPGASSSTHQARLTAAAVVANHDDEDLDDELMMLGSTPNFGTSFSDMPSSLAGDGIGGSAAAALAARARLQQEQALQQQQLASMTGFILHKNARGVPGSIFGPAGSLPSVAELAMESDDDMMGGMSPEMPSHMNMFSPGDLSSPAFSAFLEHNFMRSKQQQQMVDAPLLPSVISPGGIGSAIVQASASPSSSPLSGLGRVSGEAAGDLVTTLQQPADASPIVGLCV